ncbi:hypothetical protein [Pseudophaeobacter sp. EL27]|uniref:hypothetical protein n=1 Tax=Pseudophaeobacter sp. EL27 TaxID=2107580 RepID=UPI000EFB1933|nr:hypothetical protein [Pseudophaeobacter sp. EL27]
MADLTLIHTAEVHVASFASLAPDASLSQIVRADWLARARDGIDDSLRDEIASTIKGLKGPVLCSCTTIGEVAEIAGATRIDWPMMQQAALTGGPVLMAYCLDSTRTPSSALLRRAFSEIGASPDFTLLNLTDLWHLFETGDMTAFAEAITTAVLAALATRPKTSAVVLAQASMKEAGPNLASQLDIPVLTSPETALQALLPAGHDSLSPKGA